MLGLGGGGAAARDVPAAIAGLRQLSARLGASLAARAAPGAEADAAAAADLQAEARAAFTLAALSSAHQLWRPEPSDGEGREAARDAGGGDGLAPTTGGAGGDLEPDAVALLRRAAAANSTEAQLALADRYLMGRGLPASCREGLHYLKLAAAAVAARVEKDGSNFHLPSAPVRLRERWSDAQAPQNDLAWDDTEEAVSVEEDAAFRGDATAQRRLGYRRLVGRGVPRDAAAAHRAFTVAAEGGDAMALYNLGYMHLNGIHVPQDVPKARSYFSRAASRGLAAGHTGLGVLAFEGAGGEPRNLTAARLHFEAAANGSNADAMYNLGNLHAHGLGVPKDAAAALEWYDKAYVAGHWRSPLALALLYAGGADGIDFDCSEAERLLWQFVAERSAWAPALRAALRALDSGRPWQALLRYLLLAEQGCEVAAANAAFMLQRGLGARGGGTMQLAAALLHRSSVLNSTSSMIELAAALLEHGPDLAASQPEARALLPPRGTETPYQDGYAAAAAAAALKAAAKAAERRSIAATAALIAASGGEGLHRRYVDAAVKGAAPWADLSVKAAAAESEAARASAPPSGALAPESVAVVWLRRASSMGDGEAAYLLAWMHQHGVGLPRSADKADKLLASAIRSEGDSARALVLTLASLALRAERALAAVAGQGAADAATAWLEWARDASPLSAARALPRPQLAPRAAAPTPPGGSPGGQQQQQQQQHQQRIGRPRVPAQRLELSVDRAGGGGGGDGEEDPADGVLGELLRAIGVDKVAADDVALTVMLGALAAVLWARQRQLNGPGAPRGGARAQVAQQRPPAPPPGQQQQWQPPPAAAAAVEPGPQQNGGRGQEQQQQREQGHGQQQREQEQEQERQPEAGTAEPPAAAAGSGGSGDAAADGSADFGVRRRAPQHAEGPRTAD